MILLVLLEFTALVVIQFENAKKSKIAKVNIKYQGPKDMAPFHLLLIFENPNGFEM